GIRDRNVTGVQTCALPILSNQSIMPLPRALATLWLPHPGHKWCFKIIHFIQKNRIPLGRQWVESSDTAQAKKAAGLRLCLAAFRSEERRVGKEWRGER